MESAHTSRIAESTATGFPSAAYQEALRKTEKFARDRTATVVIEGETGTGKTLLARLLHHISPRRHAPFQSFDLGAVDDAFAYDELFGHVRGAFTGAHDARNGLFASAAGGTVFLDEIGKASRQVQQKLLRVVEYREVAPLGVDRHFTVDVRVVCATNVPLERLVKDEKFLPDLNARLKGFRIPLPPLRERVDDIPLLAQQIVARWAPECGYAALPKIDDELMAVFKRASWPHNLRELDEVIHRLLVEAEGAEVLTPALCVDDLSYLLELQQSKAPLEIEAVRQALAEAGQKKTQAAKLLGVSRSTIHRVIREADSRAD